MCNLKQTAFLSTALNNEENSLLGSLQIYQYSWTHVHDGGNIRKKPAKYLLDKLRFYDYSFQSTVTRVCMSSLYTIFVSQKNKITKISVTDAIDVQL